MSLGGGEQERQTALVTRSVRGGESRTLSLLSFITALHHIKMSVICLSIKVSK
jgi:hypothetical protein